MKKSQEQEQGYVFKDYNSKGKDRRWKERKLNNIDLGKRLEVSGFAPEKFERVYRCAEWMVFRIQHDETLRLYQTYFCSNKLCPICNWRRSMKHSHNAIRIIDEALNRVPGGRFVFLTLSARNVCTGDELAAAMEELHEGFRRLIGYKKVKKNLLGFLRSTEVTVSANRYKFDEKEKSTEEENSWYGSYNQHIHVLMFMKPTYFSGGNYINQQEWRQLWQRALGVDYLLVVHVETVKPREVSEEIVRDLDSDIWTEEMKNVKNMGLKKAAYEVAKYPVKPIEMIGETEEERRKATVDLEIGLEGKRQIGYGGLFRQIVKDLKLKDVEDKKADLLNTKDEELSVSYGREIVVKWDWHRQNYYPTFRKTPPFMAGI